ncbi:MAG: hypothetical protein ABEJ06_02860 [Haloarculaceae archaeon]
MPSPLDRALDVTRASLPLAAVPAVASLASFSNVARALASGPGGGMTFPFPTGLPTLWTYVSLSGVPGGGASAGPLSLLTFVPLFVAGLLVTSALEAGFLGALHRRIDERAPAFGASVRQFTLRIVGVNLLRAAVVLLALPLMVFPPLALLVVIVGGYLLYGLPFVVVVRDAPLGAAFESTVSHALDAGRYATFGIAHLVGGALASFALTALVRNGGLPGILLGTAVIAVPAVFVAVYGLLVFRDFADAAAPAAPPNA